MALIPCPACGRQVSQEAPACPQCGQPIAARRTAAQPQQAARSGCGCFSVLALLAVLAIVPVIVLAATKPSEQTHRDALAAKNPGFQVGAAIGEAIGTAKYKYNDYLLFSTMSVVGIDGKERQISTGALGMVSAKDIMELR